MSYRNKTPTRCVVAFSAGLLLSPVFVAAQDDDQEELEEILVLGTQPERYQSGRSDSLTGFPLDFLEMPRIVETIPEQLILDQKVTELDEALRNVPGISLSDGFGGTNDDFFLRGYRRNTVYRDGLRRRSNFKINTTNIERVEVIKGPASIGFGQVDPGGLVNVVTKAPLDEPWNYVELRGGRWSNYLALLDISRPVNESFGFRVVGSLQDSESFRDFTTIKRNVIAATGRLQLTDATSLGVSIEVRDEERPLDRGTIAVAVPGGTRAVVNTVADIPRSRRFGEPFEIFETEFQFYGLDLNHEFNDRWSLRAAVAFETSDSDDIQARPRGIFIFDESVQFVDGFFADPLNPPTPESEFDEPTDQIWLARRVDGSQDREIDATFANLRLTGFAETGSITHLLSFSADYRDDEESRFFGTTPNTNGVTTPLFDINNPVYGNLQPVFSGGFQTDTNTDEYGFAIQDFMRFNDKFAALIGLRFDVADADGDGPLDDADETSPQVGLLYSPTDTVSLFASYSEAFVPNTSLRVDLDGNVSVSEPFPPENSEQTEFGVKSQFFDGKLNVSVAVYDIKKENVVIGSGDDAELVDGQDAQGFEVSANGQPIPGMNVVFGYAHTDTELPDGTRPRNVAENTANGWISYEFQGGSMAGVGFGTGFFYSDDRFGDNANTWSLGDYTTYDASIWYNLPFSFSGRDETLPTRIQLSGKNLSDEEYFPASGFNNGQRVNIGTPRSWFISVTTRW